MNADEDRGSVLMEELLHFAVQNKLIEESDVVFMRNRLMDFLEIREPLSHPEEVWDKTRVPEYATPILEKFLDYCYEKGILEENTQTFRDLLDTRIMGLLLPRPSEILRKFKDFQRRDGIRAATDYFYCLCRKSDYIRMDRIAKNRKWDYKSSFGNLNITINLTKPEKDPREIAALKSAPQSGYPKCLLCPENVGYAGRIDHPARQTHRTLPLDLCGETWYFQYSPYVYYNEHCIVLKEKHVPMKLTRETFDRLFQFLDIFPHYFIGSNADLPIVGGSILNHDHFQGGRSVFPMEKAHEEYSLVCDGFPDVQAAVVRWPMSTLRLRSSDPEKLGDLAFRILTAWRKYSDPEREILAFTTDPKGNHIPHNTITPIARRKPDESFELDLVFRNNRTSEKYPLGIFHPHSALHHIKKENIGLIEVMGLFILPGRLQKELGGLKEHLTGTAKESVDRLDDPEHPLHSHSTWIRELISQYGSSLSEPEAESVLKNEVGAVCQQVLTDAGVFKVTSDGRNGLDQFLATVGLHR